MKHTHSIKAIAESLNLSVATVSWVLSGKGDEKKISLATQERILAYTQKVGYRPNMLARALNVGRSNTVGLIIPSISDTFYAGIAKVVEQYLDKMNYSLMICSSDSDGTREDRMINILKSHQVDGIIVAPTKKSKFEIQRLIEEKYPLVLFDRFFQELPTNYVLINNQESSFKLVEHIIQKGARKIAILTTNPHLFTLNLRMEGYLNALKQYNIDIYPDLIKVVDIHNYKNEVSEVMDQIFMQEPDVDGFFFTTHILAIEAFDFFISKNIDYNKLSLACIHEESLFRIIAPKINVALMPISDIGKCVVDILLKQINVNKPDLAQENKEEMERIIIPCKLIYRD